MLHTRGDTVRYPVNIFELVSIFDRLNWLIPCLIPVKHGKIAAVTVIYSYDCENGYKIVTAITG